MSLKSSLADCRGSGRARSPKQAVKAPDTHEEGDHRTDQCAGRSRGTGYSGIQHRHTSRPPTGIAPAWRKTAGEVIWPTLVTAISRLADRAECGTGYTAAMGTRQIFLPDRVHHRT
jgi:hypothetical protein